MRAAASTSWTGRFARRSVDAAIASSRSAHRVIAAMRIARRPVGWWPVARVFAPRASAIAAVPKAVSIIAITSARTVPE
jgi:hypothetical protein